MKYVEAEILNKTSGAMKSLRPYDLVALSGLNVPSEDNVSENVHSLYYNYRGQRPDVRSSYLSLLKL